MPPRRSATLVLAAVVTLAACGSSDRSDTATASPNVDGDVVAVGPAPVPGDGVGGLGDAVEVAAGAPEQANGATCTVARRTLETAVEAYELLTGSLPTSQQELVDAQTIREPSPHFEVGADGAVIPASGSPCS